MHWQIDLGDLRVIAIEDGHFLKRLDQWMPKWDWNQVDRDSLSLDEDDRVRVSMGCFLVEARDDLVLIDTGGGPDSLSPAGFTTGRLLDELAVLGIDRNAITAIVHSHLHFDHWGGDVIESGEAAFENAEIFVHGDELEWGRESRPEVRERFLPLVEAGRVATFDEDITLFPGISVEATPGHTPGHVAVALRGSTDSALIVGDVTHHPVQLQHSAWGVGADNDPEMAADTRERVFGRLGESDEIMMAGHWPGPAWGRLVSESGQRMWRPL